MTGPSCWGSCGFLSCTTPTGFSPSGVACNQPSFVSYTQGVAGGIMQQWACVHWNDTSCRARILTVNVWCGTCGNHALSFVAFYWSGSATQGLILTMSRNCCCQKSRSEESYDWDKWAIHSQGWLKGGGSKQFLTCKLWATCLRCIIPSNPPFWHYENTKGVYWLNAAASFLYYSPVKHVLLEKLQETTDMCTLLH